MEVSLFINEYVSDSDFAALLILLVGLLPVINTPMFADGVILTTFIITLASVSMDGIVYQYYTNKPWIWDMNGR
jgi:hypothetical protein